MCHSPGCGYRGIRYFRDSIVLPDASRSSTHHPWHNSSLLLLHPVLPSFSPFYAVCCSRYFLYCAMHRSLFATSCRR
ncbi:unnamed protein product [Cylicocyclus nassatus]|uniref:Uncharacterized protein n=1 Tax=Cylicocyclus nassatus TaxID=53992 RepID=A0AA36GMD4_CYLNA|nr:unnamed protein product [Cylicocyclus nassatus]